jgi:integrase
MGRIAVRRSRRGGPNDHERGRTLDVHALRHTLGTQLSRGGIAPRTAEAATRHSFIQLTMNVYTDPELLDVAGAVEALPCLTLSDHQDTDLARRNGV